jgi:ectoine hydroxylase-related dioxygenase (phytanoyl-CoA dioxygenase family)
MVLSKQSLKEEFIEQGFVVVKGVMDPETVLDPIISEYYSVLDNLCTELFENGILSSKFENLTFDERVIKICQETGKTYSGYFDFSLPFKGVTEATPFWTGPSVFNALTNENLLDEVEKLIGPEIYSNPVQHVRIKPPEKYIPKNKNGVPILGATAWHQDHGVVTEEADDTNMITTWFSLTDTPLESGPLKVVPGSHRSGLLTHCDDYGGNGEISSVGARQIPNRLFEHQEAIPLPVERGDVILMHKQTVHGSYSNLSENVRWSFDLRYNPIGQHTGRALFPGFVARSQSNPQSELRDPEQWRQNWLDCRTEMAKLNREGAGDVPFSRWADGHPDCEY